MRIQHNISAMNAYRNYTNNTSALAKNLEKLSTGYRINRAGDDAAGLAISEKMRAQISGLEQAQSNAKSGINLIQTGEGALTEVHDMLNRMYTLAEQSANGTYDDDVDRVQLQKEVDSLRTEINRIAESTNFNGINLLDGLSGSGSLSEVPVEYGTISAADGVTSTVKDGGGSAGQYTIDVSSMFSNGDTIAIYGTSDGTNALSSAGFTAGTKVAGAGLTGANNGVVVSGTTLAGTVSANTTFTIGGTAYNVDLSSFNSGTDASADVIAKVQSDLQTQLDAANAAGAAGTSNYTQYSNLQVTANSGGGFNVSWDETPMTYSSTGTDHVTLTAGTDFSGDTLEEQAASLEAALNTQVGGYFEISRDGTSITLTARTDGVDDAATISKVDVSNVDMTLTSTVTAATDGSNGTAYVGAFEVLGGTAASGNVAVGDELTFRFTDAQGKTLEAKVTVTDEMAVSDAAKATEALTKALNEATFEDNADTTGVDESQLKVSDLFTLAANTSATGATNANGTIQVTANNAGDSTSAYTATEFEINKDGVKSTFAATEGTPAAANTTAGVAQVYATDVPTTNFSTGDKLKITGSLSDGRTFEVELEAGTDFEIDDDATNGITNTIANAVAALQSADVTVTTTNSDGTAGASMTGADLFGDKGEFTVAANAGAITITSKNAGTAANHNASTITSVSAVPLSPASATLSKNAAEANTAAETTITLDEDAGYGTVIKIGDKNYEIVADARDTSSRDNIAVVVPGLATGETCGWEGHPDGDGTTGASDVAKALAAAVGANEPDYTSVASGNTVTITSNALGSEQKALTVDTPYGDKIKTATFKFDTDAVKEGSKFEFNGNTYEFVEKGSSATIDGATAIEVADFSKATAKSLGDAFASVIKDGVATVAGDGTITLRGVEAEDGTISDPKIKFDNNLTLQIGDTAEDFNQMTIALEDCHADAMGIGDIDISTQEGAAAALDAINNAINYVSDVRGTFGALQNRLDHTINNLSVAQENIQDAESYIRDVDVAKEMMEYTKNSILVQSAQAMLAQANQLPQGVLQLLQ